MYAMDRAIMRPFSGMSSKAPLQQMAQPASRGLEAMRAIARPPAKCSTQPVELLTVPLLAMVAKECSGNVWGEYCALLECEVEVEDSPDDFNDWGWARDLADEICLPAALTASLHIASQSSLRNEDSTRRCDKKGNRLDESHSSSGHIRCGFQRLVAASGDQALIQACLPPDAQVSSFLEGEPPWHTEHNPLWHNECGTTGVVCALLRILVLAVQAGLCLWEKLLCGGRVDAPAAVLGANAGAAAGHASGEGAVPAHGAASGSQASAGAERVDDDATSDAGSDDSAATYPKDDKAQPAPQLPVVAALHDLVRRVNMLLSAGNKLCESIFRIVR